MAVGREIRTKISSIRNTQKITSAMELVAASKMRKAQMRMQASRPYADKLRDVMSHVAHSHSEYRHPYLIPREIKRVGFVIVSSDRGLCGSLNVNLFRALVQKMQALHQQGIEIELCTIGRRAELFFKRLNAHIVAKVDHLGDKPSIIDLIGSVKVMLDAYDTNRLDAIYLANNQFVNTMTQKPVIEQLIPVVIQNNKKVGHWDYIYEPDARQLLNLLLVRYVETMVYQAVVENIASEQAARMIAMKNATENAGELIDELKLMYNKSRQASITREIAEITAGAGAIES